MAILTSGQRQFRDRLAQKTGLNAGVITAWMLAEENQGAARARQAQNNHNWLNIAYYATGPGEITRRSEWRNPTTAADATAAFLRGERYGPSTGIRQIIKTASKSPGEQMRVISGSGWSSGYNGGATLRNLYSQYGRGVEQPASEAPQSQPQATVNTKGLDAKQQALLRIAGKLSSSPFDRGGGAASQSNPLYSLLSRRANQQAHQPKQQKAERPSASTSTLPGSTSGQVTYGGGPALTHPSIRRALALIAGQYGHALTVGTTTNHSKYTTSGNISDHYSGNAADIPASGQALTRMGQAAMIALGKPASWARQQTGGVFNIQRDGKRYQVLFNTNVGGNHYNHLHVGVK